MDEFKAAVYSPPFDGLPYLAVVFDPNGEVLAACSAEIAEKGQAFLERVIDQLHDRVTLIEDATIEGKAGG